MGNEFKGWDSLSANQASPTPYEEGYAAGKGQRSWSACPYDFVHHSMQYRDWMRGYADGRRDHMKSNPWDVGQGYWLGGNDTGPRYSL